MTPAAPPAGVALRRVHPDEAAGVRARLESWLSAPGKLGRTYPQVFGPAADAEAFALFAGVELLSHAATRGVRIRTPDGEARALLVGSVATAPAARGAGLASGLLRRICAGAGDAGHDVVMLWSDRWDFYRRLGFAPSGEQWEAEIAREPGAVDARVRPASAGDLPALLRLHRRKPVAVERGLGELAVLLSAAPMTTMVLERDDEITAYACHGKGLDFGGWWHEVGGADREVAVLLRGAMAALRCERATVMLPPYRRALLEHLGAVVQSVRRGVSSLSLGLTGLGAGTLFVDGLDSI